jgi:hypothetical protein
MKEKEELINDLKKGEDKNEKQDDLAS